jgi:hypothetical protein
MSVNHQYMQFAGKAIAKYVKTVPYNVSGYRLNPLDLDQRVDFMLSTPDKNFDYETKKVKEFTYDDEVLELYSEREAGSFLRMNRTLIETGLIKEFVGDQAEIKESNFLSDEAVAELVSTKLPAQLKNKLKEIDSLVTLERVLEAAKNKGRAYTIVQVIEARISELGDDQ